MRPLVVLVVVLLVSMTAFGVEIPINEPAVGPAPGHQFRPTVASNGTDYLVLWIDQRVVPAETRATRVSRDGKVLDPTGIRIAPYEIFHPLVIWSGTSYAIVWGTSDNRMWIMRIDDDGAIVAQPRVLLENAQPSSIALGLQRLAIGYRSTAGEARALTLFLDDTIAKDLKLGEGALVQLAFNNAHFGAVWYDDGEIRGVRFNESDAIAGSSRVFETGVLDPRLSSDRSDFLLLTRDDNQFRLVARRIRADFESADASSLLPAGLYSEASLLWAETHYVVVAERGMAVSAVRLDTQGRSLDAGPIAIENVVSPGSAPSPAAATNGQDLYVAWSGFGNEKTADTYGAGVKGATLARTSRELLSASATRQVQPAIARIGSTLLTIWQEPGGLYARRTAGDGRALDSAPLRIAFNALAATVVAHGDGWVVAWLEEDAIVTRRVPLSGELRAEGGGRLKTTTLKPLAAASDGTSTVLLTWLAQDGLKAARVRADGTFVDSVPVTIADEKPIGKVAVSSNGTDAFLVVWGELATTLEGSSIPATVRAARVTTALTVLDPNGFDVASTAEQEGDPSVAWNGSVWLVVWARENEIRGGRVTRQGLMIDCHLGDWGVVIASDAASPVVVWDGSRHHIAWMQILPGLRPRPIRTAWLADLDAPLTDVRTLGEAEILGAGPVSLVPLANGVIAAAYSRIAREPAYGGVSRVFLELMALGARRRAAR